MACKVIEEVYLREWTCDVCGETYQGDFFPNIWRWAHIGIPNPDFSGQFVEKEFHFCPDCASIIFPFLKDG